MRQSAHSGWHPTRENASQRRRSRRHIAILVTLFIASGGCQRQNRAAPAGEQEIQSLVNVRGVRVLLADRSPAIHLRVTGPFTIGNLAGDTVVRGPRADWARLTVDGTRQLRLGNRPLGTGTLELSPERDGTIELSFSQTARPVSPRRYAGRLRISINAAGNPRIINFVDIETYVACVLPAELFPHFEQEAFRAQSVAVRTYVLYQMAQRAHSTHDVRATEASQVYPGIRTGAVAGRAREATQFTKGIVATWTSPEGERLFCTFYSACCGGRTQDVANCRTDVPSIPPLTGGVTCSCPKIATSYAWKPVRMSKREFTDRLVSRYPAMKGLGRIEDIQTVGRTSWGRPTVFRLSGGSVAHQDLKAEDLRLAIGSRTLRSSNFKTHAGRDDFEFFDGRGFGHGMGMCQWGMQEMALSGRSAAAILKHYYPTMNLTRAY